MCGSMQSTSMIEHIDQVSLVHPGVEALAAQPPTVYQTIWLALSAKTISSSVNRGLFIGTPPAWGSEYNAETVFLNGAGFRVRVFSGLLLILTTGRFFGEFGWSHPAQRRMRATLVIAYAPVLNASGILPRHEPVLIQAILPQPAVERLYSGVIRGRAWFHAKQRVC